LFFAGFSCPPARPAPNQYYSTRIQNNPAPNTNQHKPSLTSKNLLLHWLNQKVNQLDEEPHAVLLWDSVALLILQPDQH